MPNKRLPYHYMLLDHENLTTPQISWGIAWAYHEYEARQDIMRFRENTREEIIWLCELNMEQLETIEKKFDNYYERPEEYSNG
jgi:hypothetical protein